MVVTVVGLPRPGTRCRTRPLSRSATSRVRSGRNASPHGVSSPVATTWGVPAVRGPAGVRDGDGDDAGSETLGVPAAEPPPAPLHAAASATTSTAGTARRVMPPTFPRVG